MSESAPCLLLLHLLAGVAVIDDLLCRFARVALRVRPVASHTVLLAMPSVDNFVVAAVVVATIMFLIDFLAAQTAAILAASFALDGGTRNPQVLAVVAFEIVVISAAAHDRVAAVQIVVIFPVVLDIAVVDFRLNAADFLVPHFVPAAAPLRCHHLDFFFRQ